MVAAPHSEAFGDINKEVLVSSSLLSTKLGIPQSRPALVARPRLIEKLNQGQPNKLILISAPAGFGKTTLAVEWVRQIDHKITWLSLEGSDSDPARFLYYFIAALKVIEPGIGERTQAMLAEPSAAASEMVLTSLVNEIASIRSKFTLVVDDYHVIESMQTHRLLASIIEHQPVHMHLLIATREDPPLPLPRLRALGQVTEIRQHDLCFNTQETREFLQEIMGLTVPEGSIAALERRTEGWIAGLQLAALSMQGQRDIDGFVRQFTGSNRFVLDYLLEEVFAGQSEEVREFLLWTSHLERFCGPLCDYILKRSDSQERLEYLEQMNLFTFPLDLSRHWYRYHRLFGELLRTRCNARSPSGVVDIHRRAYQWYYSAGLTEDAIHHAIAAQDLDAAAELIIEINGSLLKRGEIATLLGWYHNFTDEMLQADPMLCLGYSWLLMLSGQFELASKYLGYVEQETPPGSPTAGEIAAAQAFLARMEGDHMRMIELSQRALAQLPEDELEMRAIIATNLGLAYWHMGDMEATEPVLDEAIRCASATGNHYAALTALILMGRVKAVRGHLHAAEKVFKQAIQQGAEIPINTLAYMDLSALNYEWNNLSECEANLQQAINLSERIGNDEFLVACWMIAARLKATQGNSVAAYQILADARDRIRDRDVPMPARARVAATQINVALANDDLGTAKRWGTELDDKADCHAFHRFFNLTRARLMLALDQREAAQVFLAECYDQALASGWEYGLCAVRVLQSISEADPERALGHLSPALQDAKAAGYLRTFIDAGYEIIPLLKLAIQRGIEVDYAARILAIGEALPLQTIAQQDGLVEPLSDRELEVMRLVAAGLSNRKIAEQLVISPGTVKTHVHNLCGKLGVTNRMEASVKARELGLL